MGKDTVRFSCHHCTHCCTEVVALPTPWDVKRIVKMIGADPERFLEFLAPDEIQGVEKSDPTWIECDDDRYLMALRRTKRGCHFLNPATHLCKIYEARPLLCRLFPFRVIETKTGKFKGFALHQDVECPRNKDGIVPTKPLYDYYIQDEINQEDFHDLVEMFNVKRYKNKDPDDFVTLFMHGLMNFDEWAGVQAS